MTTADIYIIVTQFLEGIPTYLLLVTTVSTTEEQTTASGASGEFHISVDFAGAGHGAIVVFKPFGPSLGNLAMGQNLAALTST